MLKNISQYNNVAIKGGGGRASKNLNWKALSCVHWEEKARGNFPWSLILPDTGSTIEDQRLPSSRN